MTSLADLQRDLQAVRQAHAEQGREAHALAQVARRLVDDLATLDVHLERDKASLKGMELPPVPRELRARLKGAEADVEAVAGSSDAAMVSRVQTGYIRARCALEVAEAERADLLVQREAAQQRIAAAEQERVALTQRVAAAQQAAAGAQAELADLGRHRDQLRQAVAEAARF